MYNTERAAGPGGGKKDAFCLPEIRDGGGGGGDRDGRGGERAHGMTVIYEGVAGTRGGEVMAEF